MDRAHVLYSGSVQGVGFRYTTMRLARPRAVTGFVRNLLDGRVELVAEGAREEVEGLLEDIRDGMSGYIRDENRSWGEATGSFTTFSVAF